MEGRWTVVVNHSDEVQGDARCVAEWRDDAIFPVVPCDDAAVERVAEALARIGGLTMRWDEIREIDRQGWREEAKAVLRAAGETETRQ